MPVPWGTSIGHLASVVAFASDSVSFNQQCIPEQRSCIDGTLSGTNTFKHASSTNPRNSSPSLSDRSPTLSQESRVQQPGEAERPSVDLGPIGQRQFIARNLQPQLLPRCRLSCFGVEHMGLWHNRSKHIAGNVAPVPLDGSKPLGEYPSSNGLFGRGQRDFLDRDPGRHFL